MRWKRQDTARIPSTLEDWLQVFPPLVQEGVRNLYQTLDLEQRSLVIPLLEEMERYLSANDLQQVLELIRQQYPGLERGTKVICIVGPVNTGKSSLYNALVGEDAEKAAVSPVPGTTKFPQSGASGVLTVVDTPGADDVEIGDEGQLEGQRRREVALEAARGADFLLIVFDASVGIGQGALAVYEKLLDLGKPYVVVLNKIDLVGEHQDRVVALAAKNLQLEPRAIIATSALKGTGLKDLVMTVIRTDPRLLLAVADVMPHFHFTLAQRRTIQAATAAGTVNLATSPIPIPFASFVPLTGIQAGLVLSIARIYGYQITMARARELLAAFAAGLGARTLFQQLVTKIPGAGWVVGTAIASATTLTIGYSAIAWFGLGKEITAQTTRGYLERLTQEITKALQDIDRQSLSRQGLSDILEGVAGRVFQ
jgi:small GTP-binding protein